MPDALLCKQRFLRWCSRKLFQLLSLFCCVCPLLLSILYKFQLFAGKFKKGALDLKSSRATQIVVNPLPPKQGSSLFIKIPYYYFDTRTQHWLAASLSHLRQAQRATAPEALRVVTYNVTYKPYFGWFFLDSTRWEYIINVLLSSLNADVICLNEVCDKLLERIKSAAWVKKGYYLSEIEGDWKKKKNLIISRFAFARLYKEVYGRQGAVSGCIILGEAVPLWICCCCLGDKPSETQKRKAQLDNLYQKLEYVSTEGFSIILGCLNFYSEKEEANIQSPYIDLWPHLCKGQNGHTYSRGIYGFLKWPGSDGTKKLRPDRILFNYNPCLDQSKDERFPAHHPASKCIIEPVSMFLFGNEPISSILDLYASNHYGLAADFKVKLIQ
ncbi:uncharacterized protein LOC126320601 [Schistocerca gregaria]|uniref:uncharacterized protein LOC126320601 n=1 Tax=Schistocerca gregaria TaxID=7010 RepID=UPI00211F2D40|nr:uncharacterized protein LOC126320601 [Schistocerca gregaria]